MTERRSSGLFRDNKSGHYVDFDGRPCWCGDLHYYLNATSKENVQVELTAQEKNALYETDESCGCGGIGEKTFAAVAQIIQARRDEEGGTS